MAATVRCNACGPLSAGEKTQKWYKAKFSRNGFNKEDSRSLSSKISYDIDPEHVEALQRQRKANLAEPDSKPKPHATDDTPTETYYGPSRSDESSPPLTRRPEEKQKSRPNQVNSGQSDISTKTAKPG